MCENKRIHLTEEEVAARLPHKGNSNFLGEAIVDPGVSATATLRKIPILVESRQKTVPWFMAFDAMAQTIILAEPPREDRIGVLTGINRISIERPIRVGEIVKFTADKIRTRPNFGKAHVTTRASGEIIIDGEMSFSVVSLDTLKGKIPSQQL